MPIHFSEVTHQNLFVSVSHKQNIYEYDRHPKCSKKLQFIVRTFLPYIFYDC